MLNFERQRIEPITSNLLDRRHVRNGLTLRAWKSATVWWSGRVGSNKFPLKASKLHSLSAHSKAIVFHSVAQQKKRKSMASSSCAPSTFSPFLHKFRARNSIAMVGLLSYSPKTPTPISLTKSSFTFISLSTPRKPLKKSFQGDFFIPNFVSAMIFYVGPIDFRSF